MENIGVPVAVEIKLLMTVKKVKLKSYTTVLEVKIRSVKPLDYYLVLTVVLGLMTLDQMTLLLGIALI